MRTATTYFVDTENVSHAWADILPAAGRGDEFVLFYTVQTQNPGMDLLDRILGHKARFRCVRSETGHNGLDFTLVAELGRVVELDRAKATGTIRHYVIVSNDQGFDTAVTHLNGLGFVVERRPIDLAGRASASAAPAAPKPDEKKPEAKPAAEQKPVHRTLTSKPAVINEYKKILVGFPDITNSDASVCAPYIYMAMLNYVNESDMKVHFHANLQKYYKNPELATKVYARVKPGLEAIIKDGPFPVAKKKK